MSRRQPKGALNEALWSKLLDRDGLTVRQWEMLCFIAEYTRLSGHPPVLRDIMGHFNYTSTNGAVCVLRKLEAKGRVRMGGGPRTLTIHGLAWEPRRADGGLP